MTAAGGARTAFLVLAIGVVAASSSSILVRFAQQEGVASLAIAAWRLLFASFALVPIALMRRRAELAALGRRDLAVAVAAGLLLALHFVSWISSLAYTSVASSAALVSTNPIWVGLATVLLLRQRLARRTVAGIAVTLVGCLLILAADAFGPAAVATTATAGATPGAAPGVTAGATVVAMPLAGGRQPLAGNLLALAGAVCVSAYLLVGRGLASRFSLLLYIALVYGAAAIALGLAALAVGVPLTGYGGFAWLMLVGLAVGPQLIGHTAFNWALRRLSPTFVALSILGEPVGSALLAAALLGEVPGWPQAVALAVLLGGIAIAASAEAAPPASPDARADDAPAAR